MRSAENVEDEWIVNLEVSSKAKRVVRKV